MRLLLDEALPTAAATGRWQGATCLRSPAGDLAAMQALIAANADPLYKTKDGTTAFQIALSRGYEPIVSLLLDKGADVNSRDRNGGTPLHEAVRQGKLDLVKKLIAKGADIHARTEQPKGVPPSPFTSGIIASRRKSSASSSQ